MQTGLIAQIKAGDRRAFDTLCRERYVSLISYARLFLAGVHTTWAEDVVQDIFLRVARNDIPPKNDNYLLVAVRNACLNRIRQKQLHEKVRNLLPIDTDADFQPIDKELERLEDIAAFVNEQMEEPHRSIFHLRFDEDLTIAEIARRLGLNPNTTYKYLAQCMEHIRQHFNIH